MLKADQGLTAIVNLRLLEQKDLLQPKIVQRAGWNSPVSISRDRKNCYETGPSRHRIPGYAHISGKNGWETGRAVVRYNGSATLAKIVAARLEAMWY